MLTKRYINDFSKAIAIRFAKMTHPEAIGIKDVESGLRRCAAWRIARTCNIPTCFMIDGDFWDQIYPVALEKYNAICVAK